MDLRPRDIILAVVAVAVVAAIGFGGYAAVRARAAGERPVRQVLAPVVLPTVAASTSASPEPQYERWTVGVARRPVTVRTKPDSGAPVLVELGTRTAADYPTVLLVDDIRESGGTTWYRVWVPVRPNGTRGWVEDGSLAFYTTPSKIEVDLSERTLSVFRRGRLEDTWPVAVGRPGLATPTGQFFVTLKLRPPDPGGAYGVLALGTSAFQPKLKDWPGGGVVGIHGTNEPGLIGQAISHGCIRMKNSAIVQVSRLVPTGSPVFIRE